MADTHTQGKGSFAGYVSVLGATIIWSVNFIVARALADSVPPVSLAFLRWLVAVVVILPFAVTSLRTHRKSITENLGYLALTALLGVTLFNTLVYMAGHSSAALNMSLIATTSPVFVVILERIFFKETITPRRITGLVAATIGVALLVTHGELSLFLTMTFTKGDLWMLLAAAIFAGYSILVKRKPGDLNERAFLASIFTLGLLFLLPWLAWERCVPQMEPRFSMTALWSILYLGVGPSLLAFILWNRAIYVIGPVRSSFVYYSLPVFSGLEASVILREPIDWIHLVSGLLILSGIIVATSDANTRSRQ